MCTNQAKSTAAKNNTIAIDTQAWENFHCSLSAHQDDPEETRQPDRIGSERFADL